jgi:hypothetical protein
MDMTLAMLMPRVKTVNFATANPPKQLNTSFSGKLRDANHGWPPRALPKFIANVKTDVSGLDTTWGIHLNAITVFSGSGEGESLSAPHPAAKARLINHSTPTSK